MADMHQTATVGSVSLTTPFVEPWVDAEAVAKHLNCKGDHVRKMARKGKLNANNVRNGSRDIWRFKISLVDKWLAEQGAAA